MVAAQNALSRGKTASTPAEHPIRERGIEFAVPMVHPDLDQ